MAAQIRPDAREATAKSLGALKLLAWACIAGGAVGWFLAQAYPVMHGRSFWSEAPNLAGSTAILVTGLCGLLAFSCLKRLAARISDLEDRRALADARQQFTVEKA